MSESQKVTHQYQTEVNKLLHLVTALYSNKSFCVSLFLTVPMRQRSIALNRLKIIVWTKMMSSAIGSIAKKTL